MAYCAKCGVEIISSSKNCPLCGYKIDENLLKKEIEEYYPKTTPDSKNIASDKKNILPLITAALLSSFLIVYAINWSFEKTITWAAYPMSSIAFIWIVTIFFLTLKNLFFKFITLSISICGYLIIIDLFSPPVLWSLKIGMPITLLITFILLIQTAIIKQTTAHALLIALMLIFICIACIGIDVILSLQIFQKILTGWSIVVISALLPIVIYLLYFHYYLKKAIDLKKIFHV